MPTNGVWSIAGEARTSEEPCAPGRPELVRVADDPPVWVSAVLSSAGRLLEREGLFDEVMVRATKSGSRFSVVSRHGKGRSTQGPARRFVPNAPRRYTAQKTG